MSDFNMDEDFEFMEGNAVCGICGKTSSNGMEIFIHVALNHYEEIKEALEKDNPKEAKELLANVDKVRAYFFKMPNNN